MANGRENRGDRLVAGSAWAEARAVGGTARFPFGVEGAFDQRVAGSIGHGRHAQGSVFRCRVRRGTPDPANRCGSAIEGQGLCQRQALRGCEGVHAVHACCPSPWIVLGHPPYAQELRGPGMPHQALEPADWADIATTGGLVHALLPRKHVPVETGPWERVPSIHRSGDRVHSVYTATRPCTVHVVGSPSAYPLAFPGALACETIPLPARIRWTPTPCASARRPAAERTGGQLLRSWGVFGVARRVGLSAGVLWHASWITGRRVQPFSLSVLDQADTPRRLVAHHDGSVAHSCTSPSATVLGGMPWWIQGDRLSGPLHRVEGQALPWGMCITPASGGEELHLYTPQVIKDRYGLNPSSLAVRPFRGNGSQLSPVPGFPRLRVL
jgi:hypothetical protein